MAGKNPWATMANSDETVPGGYIPAPPDGPMDKLSDWMYNLPTRGQPAPGEYRKSDDEDYLEYLWRTLTGG